MKPKVLAVVGPTASGKSGLAVALAKEFGGQILSCDSMQVYRGMDIGTAKVTEDEMQGVVHHLIDIVDPDENFSCAQYAQVAKEKTAELLSRGVLPVFCGGTGQYLDAVLTDNVFSGAGIDEELRTQLNAREVQDLWEELSRIDPDAASATHPNNKKRVVRALETYYLTGITKTEWDRRSRESERPYDALIIGLCVEGREALYRRIDERVDEMIAQGLVEEMRALHLRPGTTASEAIGYKELAAYLRGEQDLASCVDQIKRASRRYAKRQMTWFRANGDIRWLQTDTCSRDELYARAKAMVKEFLSN